MLAVFDKTVAKCPEGLTAPAEGAPASGGGAAAASLVDLFTSTREAAVAVNLGAAAAMAYSTQRQNPLLPRSFAAVDGIFCLFEGEIENIAVLKQQYGLNKTANEVIIVIEAYRTLRDRGPYPADQVVRDLQGRFAFVLFDAPAGAAFVAADAEEGVPFFWGADSAGRLVFSDDAGLVAQACVRSFSPFPKGCFFTTSGGLQSYEHPLNELKPMPRVDSRGQVCGVTYKVDEAAKKETAGMRKVGSAANWSSQY